MFSAHRYLCNWSIKLSEPKSQGFHKETAASILVKRETMIKYRKLLNLLHIPRKIVWLIKSLNLWTHYNFMVRCSISAVEQHISFSPLSPQQVGFPRGLSCRCIISMYFKARRLFWSVVTTAFSLVCVTVWQVTLNLRA